MSSIYYCVNENNKCEKKETCRRYLHVSDNNAATLFKNACTENNNYLLYIKETINEQNPDA